MAKAIELTDLSRRKFLATVGTAATLVALGPWVPPLRLDPDESVWAWDPPHGVFVGVRRFLPDHLRGQETAGSLGMPDLSWAR